MNNSRVALLTLLICLGIFGIQVVQWLGDVPKTNDPIAHFMQPSASAASEYGFLEVGKVYAFFFSYNTGQPDVVVYGKVEHINHVAGWVLVNANQPNSGGKSGSSQSRKSWVNMKMVSQVQEL